MSRCGLLKLPNMSTSKDFNLIQNSRYKYLIYLISQHTNKLEALTPLIATSPNPIFYRIPSNMQTALCFAPSLPPLIPTKTSTTQLRILPKLASRCLPIKATPEASDASTVDYSSLTSVFPAEACDTIGGDACDAKMYPEAKLKPEDKSTPSKKIEESVDREYIEYNDPKTVFLEEACDDLGGEFCQPEYQKSVN